MSSTATPAPALVPAAQGGGRSLLARPVLMWALALWGFAVFFARECHFADVVFRLAVPDTDDAMRLVEVRDFVAGQGWFDITQHRFLPPEGASMHWSRLVDVPLAALMLALTPVLGTELAEGVVAAGWPPLLLLANGAVIARASYRLWGPAAAGFATFVLSQSVYTMLFVPGRVDHHNVQGTLILVASLAVARCVSEWRSAVVAGALAGLSLAIGLESLPFVAALGLLEAARWIMAGKPASRSLLGFAISLALSTALFYVLQTDPRAWGIIRWDALSPPWLALTSGSALIATGLVLAGARLVTWRVRLAGAGVLAGLFLLLWGTLYPGFLGGPFGGMPAVAKQQWLDRVTEALPLWRAVIQIPYASIPGFGPLLVAALLATMAARRLGLASEKGRVLAVHAALLWTGVLLCVGQIRGFYIAAAFVPIVAGAVFSRGLELLRQPARANAAASTLVVGLALVGTVWAAGVFACDMAVTAIRPPPSAPRVDKNVCQEKSALKRLERLSPGVVLAQIDLGPFLLLQTHHAIVAAPYHRNVEGLVASLESFGGSEADMRRAAVARGADYVVLCSVWLRPEDAGTFAHRLSEGARVDWLEPLDIGSGPLAAWRVRKPADAMPR